MPVIWSVDNKENSQGLFNIPVWSVCSRRKLGKKKEKRKKTIHDRKQTKCESCVCQFWWCHLRAAEAQR